MDGNTDHGSLKDATRQAEVSVRCQFCDSVMIEKSVSGTHLDGREDEAYWFECQNCNHATDAQ